MDNYRVVGIIILIVALVGVFWWSAARRDDGVQQATETEQGQQTNAEMLDNQSEVAVTAADQTYGTDFKGFYAHPEEAGSYPGVVMVHEWWGLNDHIKDMARQLAREGYSVMAVDLYDGKVATVQADAQKYRTEMNQERAVSHMRAAATFLRQQGASKIASLGWCFGGGQALQMALSGEPLDATVIYYGNLVTDQTQLSKIKWPVLGIFGDQDQSIPVATVNEFDRALDTLGVQNNINIYPGVGHAFANPSGMNYAANETKDAWEKTLNFLNNNLKGQSSASGWNNFLLSFVR